MHKISFGFQQVSHGLYLIVWKDGGSSLASVGSDSAGRRWYAPTNWVNGMPCFDWEAVDHLRVIQEG